MIVEHIAIVVRNLGRSIDFYTKAFGFKVLRRASMHVGAQTYNMASLYLGNDLLELAQSIAPVAVDKLEKVEKSRTLDDWLRHLVEPVGLRHIGFRVDVGDLDQTVARIKKLGGELVMPPKRGGKGDFKYVAEVTDDKLRRAARPKGEQGWRFAFLRDPDGVLLEILER